MKRMLVASLVISILVAIIISGVSAAPAILVYAWTDKPQYEPGENGKLKISVLNGLDEPVSIDNISIVYPWSVYDAENGEWLGNETMKGEPLATMTSKGTENDHYHGEAEFTVPSDGRAAISGSISIYISTSKGIISISVDLSVATPSWPMSITDLDVWMTTLTNVLNSTIQETETSVATLNSQIGQLQGNYSELENQYESLSDQMGTTTILLYIFSISTIIFMATTVYLALRKPRVKP